MVYCGAVCQTNVFLSDLCYGGKVQGVVKDNLILVWLESEMAFSRNSIQTIKRMTSQGKDQRPETFWKVGATEKK